MSDFLKNLRSSTKKEVSPPRKKLEGNYFQHTERRSMDDRRNSGSTGNFENLSRQIGDTIPEILEHTTTLTEQVEKLAATNELVAEAKIRQHNAVADFFNNLNKMVLGTSEKNIFTDPQKVTTSYASGTHYTKDDILSIIQKMRDEGATFSIIAEYLTEKGMPTFSGRGEWHAQTIHRLCK